MCRNRVSINVSKYARQKCVARARPVGAQCARALNRRAAFLFHVDTCIFPRDKTGLTMGKPEVNLTFFFFSFRLWESVLREILPIFLRFFYLYMGISYTGVWPYKFYSIVL